MPEILQPSLEQAILDGRLQEIGHGSRGIVYIHPENDGQVIKIYNETENSPESMERFIIAELILSKIMKSLCPEAISAVIAGSTKPRPHTIKERLEIEPRTRRRQSVHEEDFNFGAEIARRLRSFGYQADPAPWNYGRREDGSLAYAESLDPWDLLHGQKFYDEKKLRESIGLHMEGQKQAEALKNLERLEEIYKQEQKERAKITKDKKTISKPPHNKEESHW